MKMKLLLFVFVSILISISEQKPNEEFTSQVLGNNKKNSNWFTFGDKTYYIDTLFRANFFNSMMFCRHLGMHLVSINSKLENDQIGKFIKQVGKPYGEFWTSARYLGEGQWGWLSTGQNMVYSNWHPGEPNQIEKNNEYCVEFRGATGNTWNDRDCDFQCYFICESIKDCVDNKSEI